MTMMGRYQPKRIEELGLASFVMIAGILLMSFGFITLRDIY